MNLQQRMAEIDARIAARKDAIDRKLGITPNEAKAATPSPVILAPTPVSPTPSPATPATPQATCLRFPRKWRWWAIAGGVALVVVLGVCLLLRSLSLTVPEYRANLIQKVNSELENPSSKLRMRIESAHLTVTVTSGIVKKCDIETLDGSDRVGRHNSNIANVTLEIEFGWSGIFENGHTTLRIVQSGQDKVVTSEIIETTAMWNSEDSECWKNAGMFLLMCL